LAYGFYMVLWGLESDLMVLRLMWVSPTDYHLGTSSFHNLMPLSVVPVKLELSVHNLSEVKQS